MSLLLGFSLPNIARLASVRSDSRSWCWSITSKKSDRSFSCSHNAFNLLIISLRTAKYRRSGLCSSTDACLWRPT